MKVWKVWATARCVENGKEVVKTLKKGFVANSRELAVLKMKRELIDCNFSRFHVYACKLEGEFED